MVCEGVHDLSVEQVRTYTTYMFTLVITHSKAKVGEHFHGLHYKCQRYRAGTVSMWWWIG
jgi:hypothetical protein